MCFSTKQSTDEAGSPNAGASENIGADMEHKTFLNSRSLECMLKPSLNGHHITRGTEKPSKAGPSFRAEVTTSG